MATAVVSDEPAMRVMLFGTTTSIHCRRYKHLIRLAEADVVFVEHEKTRNTDEPGVRFVTFPLRRVRLGRFLNATVLERLRELTLKFMWQTFKADVCHVQWIDRRILQCARSGMRPLVATAWGSDINWAASPTADPAYAAVVQEAIRSVDLLIVDSHDLAQTAAKLAGRPINTLLLAIGIDTNFFAPNRSSGGQLWRERLHIDAGAKVFLSARQRGPNYRQDKILEAFALMSVGTRNGSCLLVRTFGHSPLTDLVRLERLAETLGIANNVRWVGDVPYESLPDLYSAVDAAINFPEIDAFPVTFLECLSCSLPVITNRLPAYSLSTLVPYLIFTEENTTEGLSRAMEAFYNRSNASTALSDAARMHIVQNYDERVTAKQLREAYGALGVVANSAR